MSMLYLNPRSSENDTAKSSDKRCKSVTLPASCSQYLRSLTKLSDKKKCKTVKFPSAVLMQQAINRSLYERQSYFYSNIQVVQPELNHRRYTTCFALVRSQFSPEYTPN